MRARYEKPPSHDCVREAHGQRGIAARTALAAIRGYQRILSPVLGRRCRFLPTCSDYAREAIGRFGLLRGGWLAATRIARCQPLCKGGCDPVPDRFRWRVTHGP
jgi:putative membrane protein insertion efficiency factor